MEKKYVKILSTIDITVTRGLEYTDVSQPDAHIPDRLRVITNWTKSMCDIKKETGWYPAEIVEWNSVKALIKGNFLSIQEYSDECEDVEVIKKAEKISKSPKVNKKKEEKVDLSKLADEPTLEEVAKEEE